MRKLVNKLKINRNNIQEILIKKNGNEKSIRINGKRLIYQRLSV